MKEDEKELNFQIKNIVKEDDMSKNGEEEKRKIIEETDKNLLRCKLIKDRMLPLTMEVTRELFNQCKANITYDRTLQYVKIINKYNRKKGLEDKSEKIAKSILDFLNKNGIIESDEGYENKYYFTILGEKYMQYFMNGII